MVVGPGSTCGRRLVEHPDVAKIAFTGSTEVGRSIAAGAAQTIKRVTLELGGKSPNLVFADADLEAAAAAAPVAVFGNAGQDCCARSRILVQASALDEFMALLERRGRRAVRVGDPLDEETQMGPLISADQRADRVLLRGRRRAGGDPGQRPDGPGFWFAPTVLCPVAPDARAAREEIFGPVAVVIPFARRGGGGPVGQRHDLRPVGLDLDPRRRPRAAGGPGARGRACCRSTPTPRSGCRRRSAASSSRATGASSGPHALDAYTEVKSIFYAT